jgi:hypothetical protein
VITLTALAFTLAFATEPGRPITPEVFCQTLLKVVETDTEVMVFDQMCMSDVSDNAADGMED